MTFCCGETASFVPGTALYLAVKPLSDADYDIIIFGSCPWREWRSLRSHRVAAK